MHVQNIGSGGVFPAIAEHLRNNTLKGVYHPTPVEDSYPHSHIDIYKLNPSTYVVGAVGRWLFPFGAAPLCVDIHLVIRTSSCTAVVYSTGPIVRF